MTITAYKITNPTDQEAAFRIRRQVFVQEQNVPADAEYDQHEATATHYLALADGEPVGTARWRRTENGVKLERFAVLKEFRSQQVGSHLLKVIMEDIQATHPGLKVYMHAQVGAIPFYARHGFDQVGDLFHECDIAHYQMEMNA